jgi:hypothetical protein
MHSGHRSASAQALVAGFFDGVTAAVDTGGENQSAFCVVLLDTLLVAASVTGQRALLLTV